MNKLPTTVVFEIDGEISIWGIADERRLAKVIDTFRQRGHSIRMVRALTDTSLINDETQNSGSIIWYA